LPSPGTPSPSTWARASAATSSSSTTRSWPRITLEIPGRMPRNLSWKASLVLPGTGPVVMSSGRIRAGGSGRPTRADTLPMRPACSRVTLRPLDEFTEQDWRRLQSHFRDPEISYLNGTPPNRMPLWLLKRLLKADAQRSDRETFGIFDERDEFIGTTELYDVRGGSATLG